MDVVIVGAGAAGMMCAITAAQRGRKVMLLDHSGKLAEKIRISGGGRCNFTNLNAKPENYLSDNPHFCRSALTRYTPQHFIALLDKHGIGYHEKTLGQLFCDDGSEAIIAMLKKECDAAGVRWSMPCKVEEVSHSDAFYLTTSREKKIRAAALVVASGGLSIPKAGATPFGYHIAEKFGVPITKLKPGLVPLTFAPDDWKPYAELTGISLEVVVSCGKQTFRENMLVTHRGLSGPAILQISSYWQHGEPLHINLLPGRDMLTLLEELKASKKILGNFLMQWFPKGFAEVWSAQLPSHKKSGGKALNQYSDTERKQIVALLLDWQVTPSGTMGYSKAEVTCGGVDTHALSSKTMECSSVPGLYFIGEVVDVTGQLGGYNFQWAWASGYAAGLSV